MACVMVILCRDKFWEFQKDGAKEAVDSRSGRKLTDKELERIEAAQNTKNQAVFQVGTK